MIYHWCYAAFFLLSSLLPIYAQPVPTPSNIVCYQEVVATQGTYAQINDSLSNWSQRMYQTLGLTGPIELQVGWARVPDRTGFENGCTGPYPNIADIFVHIQTTSAQFDSISSQLESFIAANRMTSQPNIVCSARSIVTFIPGCGKTGGAPINNATAAPTQAPSNATSAPTNATTSAPTNATTTSPPTNATTTSPPTNATTTSPPTNGTTTAPPTTAAPTNTTPTTSAPTIHVNVTGNSTTGNSSIGGLASDQSATGSVNFNGASTITSTWIMAPAIIALLVIFQ